MSITQVISLLSGVALFLFGMNLMGDGIKRVSGDHLEAILFKLSNTNLKGVLLGTGVTAVIQSSCATSVMAVSFVNSGMMNLIQGISVIIGAIFGTSITGWVICLSYIEGSGGLASLISTSTLTGVVAVVGILLKMFSKKPMHHNIGDIMMGFAILMTGMSTMSGSVKTVGEQPWFQAALLNMNNPVLGIAIGAAFTAILQSASAAVGIVQALSVTGAMTFGTSLSLLMGINIGAAVPVLLSAIGVGTDGKRAAFSYLVSSIVGTGTCAILFFGVNSFVHFPFMSMPLNPFSMAFVNTTYRFAMTLLLFPMIKLISKIVTVLIKEVPDTTKDGKIVLEERFLYRPALAVEQVRQALTDMGIRALAAVCLSDQLLFEYDEESYNRVISQEEVNDEYEDEINAYLLQLTNQNINEYQSGEIAKFLHAVTDFERISDHALNIAQNAKMIHDKGLVLSEGAKNDFKVLSEAVEEIVQLAINAFGAIDLDTAMRIQPLEEVIDELCTRVQNHHVRRLQNGTCSIKQAFAYNNICTDLERVSDHCSNVGNALIGISRGTIDTHDYQKQLAADEAAQYDQYVKEYSERFSL
ncbi:MAG: Na/Pi cotransporter family protein [Erysipelotrichaceae bacterium]|nr:Na/Pi cotransporter family protein [Erysipelotrichaceae bacterium]